MKTATSTFFLVLLILISILPAWAQPTIHGFAQADYSAKISGGDLLVGDERIQLRFNESLKETSFFIRADIFHDSIEETSSTDLREGFLDLRTPQIDLRIGRQIITWGIGDLIFINDTFPKNFEALFSGRPIEYLKKASDGARVNVSFDLLSFELVAIPFFEPDTLPTKERFTLFDPFASTANRETIEPKPDIDDTEVAFRAYKNLLGLDLALYAYKGFYHTPSMKADSVTNPTIVTSFFPRLGVYGASVQGSGLDGIISLEAGYYDSLDDRGGTDPTRPNPQTRFLLGYQRQIWEDFTMGLQYYLEYMHHHEAFIRSLPAGSPGQDRIRELITLRLTQLYYYQTLRFSLFVYYSPTDDDYYLIPEVRYNINDAMSITGGFNIFGGTNTTTFFGQFDKDDNIYTYIRYEF